MDKLYTALALLGVFFVYNSLFARLLTTWLYNPYQNYGFLVPLISLYYLNKNKKEIFKVKSDSGRTAGIILFLVSIVLFNIDKFFSLMAMLFGAVLYFYGFKSMKKMAFPLLFLWFMTPLPDYMLEYLGLKLKYFSLNASLKIFEFITKKNILLLNDSDLFLPNGVSLYAGLPCSGIESFMAFFVFSFVLAKTYSKKILGSLAIISSCLLLAVAINIIRFDIIYYIALNFGEGLALKAFHLFSGMTLVAVSGTIMIGGLEWLKKKQGKK